MTPGSLVLSGAAGVYVAGVFLLTPLPGLSWISLLAIVGMGGGLILKGLDGPVHGAVHLRLIAAWSFVILALLSSLRASDFVGAVTVAGSVFTAVLGASLIFLAVRNGCPYATLAWAAVAAGAVQSFLAVSQLASGESIRATALAGNANALGNQLAIVSIILLGWEFRPRILTALALLYALIATATTGSRQAVFVWFALGVIGWGRLQAAGWRRGLVSLGIVAALVVGLGAWVTRGRSLRSFIAEVVLVERLVRLGQGTDHSTSVRLDMVREAAGLWSEAPIWGLGINQFRFLSPYQTYSHNNYVELLSGLGLVGLLLFLSQHVSILGVCLRNGWPMGYRLQVALAGTILLLLSDLAEVSYYQKPFWLMIAILWILLRDSEAAEAVR